MDEQKYCRYCGAANPTRAAFCAKCGGAFSAQSSQHLSPQEAPYLEDEILNKIRGLLLPVTGKKILVGGVLLIFLIFLAAGVSAMVSPPNSGGGAGTVTPTLASTLAPTARVTVKGTATPAPSGPTLSQAQLDFLQSGMEAKGYTWTENLKQSGGVGSSHVGSTFYDGKMTKDGISYDVSLEVCKDKATADSEFNFAVNNLQELGFSGNYDSATQWTGVTVVSGQPLGASAVESATSSPYIVTTLMGSYD